MRIGLKGAIVTESTKAQAAQGKTLAKSKRPGTDSTTARGKRCNRRNIATRSLTVFKGAVGRCVLAHLLHQSLHDRRDAAVWVLHARTMHRK